MRSGTMSLLVPCSNLSAYLPECLVHSRCLINIWMNELKRLPLMLQEVCWWFPPKTSPSISCSIFLCYKMCFMSVRSQSHPILSLYLHVFGTLIHVVRYWNPSSFFISIFATYYFTTLINRGSLFFLILRCNIVF